MNNYSILLFIYGFIAIFGSGFISLIIPEKYKAKFILFCSALSSIFLILAVFPIIRGQYGFSISGSSNCAFLLGNFTLAVDGLSAFFIMIISLMGFTGALYATGYIKPYINKNKPLASHFFFLSLLISSMLLLVTVRQTILFLIVWEIMSISSFFLVAFENEKRETFKASLQYLITMHIGVVFLIAAFLLIYIKTGNYDFNSFSKILTVKNQFSNLIFILFFIGFGIKAGFIPLHIWLPNAHPAAPTHISAIMSGVMIKTGIYGILRILTYIDTPSRFISLTVLAISAITAVAGVLYAAAQKDMKKLLAYSSIENIGIIGLGIGLGMLGESYGNITAAYFGYSGALLHILNHSLFKSLLFYSAGSVYLSTHTRNMESLGGLIKKMPHTAFFFLIGSLAITGLPVFNGFISELLIYFGALNNINSAHPFISAISIISAIFLALTGAIALICFTKIFSVVFLGSARDEHIKNPVESAFAMRLASLIITIFILIIGIFPQYAFMITTSSAHQLINDKLGLFSLKIFQILSSINISILCFLGITAVILFLRNLILKNKKITYYKTWDCGYRCGNTRMQYTGASYLGPIISVIAPTLGLKINKNMPEDLFPENASYEISGGDFIEDRLVNPIVKMIKKFFDLFSWIQSGNTQAYIMYGLVFLIIIILAVMGLKL